MISRTFLDKAISSPTLHMEKRLPAHSKQVSKSISFTALSVTSYDENAIKRPMYSVLGHPSDSRAHIHHWAPGFLLAGVFGEFGSLEVS